MFMHILWSQKRTLPTNISSNRLFQVPSALVHRYYYSVSLLKRCLIMHSLKLAMSLYFTVKLRDVNIYLKIFKVIFIRPIVFQQCKRIRFQFSA